MGNYRSISQKSLAKNIWNMHSGILEWDHETTIKVPRMIQNQKIYFGSNSRVTRSNAGNEAKETATVNGIFGYQGGLWYDSKEHFLEKTHKSQHWSPNNHLTIARVSLSSTKHCRKRSSFRENYFKARFSVHYFIPFLLRLWPRRWMEPRPMASY